MNEPEDVSSVDSSHKKKSGKKKKVLLALMQALGVSDDDNSGEEHDGEDEPRSEIKARRPRKVLVKLKEGERVLDSWSSFCEQMLDWEINLGSGLAREYFESTIAEKHEVRNTYAGIKLRHPEWSLEARVAWLIKMIDHFEEEQVERDWNRLIQGKTELVMKFFGRYEKSLATYNHYEGLTYEQELKSFLDKPRIETQMALRIYMRIKPFESIEDIIDSVKTIEQVLESKTSRLCMSRGRKKDIRTDQKD